MIKGREIVIAIAGNPNSGKSTLFNQLTGARQHTANWPGVTVEYKEATLHRNGRTLKIIDLPGTYSLSAYSQEEIVARDYLLKNDVDVIINVVDATNLERNLYLTTQLLELGKGMVVALNMADIAEKLGQKVDLEKFSALLGATIVPTTANRGEGIDELIEAAIATADCTTCEAPRSTRHNPEIELELSRLTNVLDIKPESKVPVRWLLIKDLENDPCALEEIKKCTANRNNSQIEIEKSRIHLEKHFGLDLDVVIADGRYGFVGGLMREVVSKIRPIDRISISDKIDDVMLHRFLGIPIFLFLVWATFKMTFDVGGFFQNYLEMGISSLSNFLSTTLPSGPISSLLTDGIIHGVGGVIMFLPNIVVMFIIITLLEDTGYMARAAFLMDRAMHILGLHGKSFIPMLMGFGCNVPAIMATRTLDTFEDRIVTILINPLMSCTARLPIYILFTGIFFSENAAMVIFAIYCLGVLLAVLSAKIFRKLFFRKSVSPFVMELPPYRIPTIKGMAISVWERCSQFLIKAGTVILAASIIIWLLGSLPWGVGFASERSLVGRFGSWVEPLVKPLGLDWKAGVALFFGIGAKEIVVSTMGVLYGAGGTDTSGKDLNEVIAASFTPLTAFTFMILGLIYIPCIATIATIRRETASWKWTLIAIGYSLTLAYTVDILVYQTGLMMGFK